MATITAFTFNVFQENTYLVYDDTGACAIFDPGCLEPYEQEELASFIRENGLKPERLINTHCHIDHIFGNRFIADTYGLELEIHQGEAIVLQTAPQAAVYFGIPYPDRSPEPGRFIADGDWIEFGNTRLQAIFTPGHSPASLSFFCPEDRFVIAGDVLFYGSIGRTDLPGGDYTTLLSSIRSGLFPLGNDVTVYPGHGPKTTIGFEKQHNPFLS